MLLTTAAVFIASSVLIAAAEGINQIPKTKVIRNPMADEQALIQYFPKPEKWCEKIVRHESETIPGDKR